MEKVDVVLSVPKESKEIFDAVVAVVDHFKSGKSISEAVALLGPVKDAVSGWQDVAEEVSSDGLDEIVGYGSHKLIEVLRG